MYKENCVAFKLFNYDILYSLPRDNEPHLLPNDVFDVNHDDIYNVLIQNMEMLISSSKQRVSRAEVIVNISCRRL